MMWLLLEYFTLLMTLSNSVFPRTEGFHPHFIDEKLESMLFLGKTGV
jgi:hypothetical protein